MTGITVPEGWVAIESERVWQDDTAKACYELLGNLAIQVKAAAARDFDARIRVTTATRSEAQLRRAEAIREAGGEIERVMALLFNRYTTVRVTFGPPRAAPEDPRPVTARGEGRLPV